MRLLAEILVIGVIVNFGWETPWNQRVPWLESVHSATSAHTGRARHRHSPGSKSQQPLADQPVYNKDRSFTGHIFYKDADGKKYWLDARGNKHYEQ